LPLRPINILIGANGSGKSNFVGAFSFLDAIREGKLDEYVKRAGGGETLLHFGSKVTKGIEFELSFNNGKDQYELSLGRTQLDQLVPFWERAAFWDRERYPQPKWEEVPPASSPAEAGISGERVDRIGRHVAAHLRGWKVFHFQDTGRFIANANDRQGP
jgi:hypothetical protein